jgi:hypothetical protein
MKIEQPNYIPFEEITVGQVFEYRGDVFVSTYRTIGLKNDYGTFSFFNCVNLTKNIIDYLSGDTLVKTYPNAKLIVG